MGRRGSAKQRAAPLCTFAEQANQAFYKREGNFSPKEAVGMKLPLLECKLILDFFLELLKE